MTVRRAEQLAYHRPISTWWWMRKRTYFVFVMRELSSIFIAWFVVYLLLLLRAVTLGAGGVRRLPGLGGLPVGARPQRRRGGVPGAARGDLVQPHPEGDGGGCGGRPVPAVAIIGAQYAGLAVVSAFVVWLVRR